jgi:hypothetical protein
MEVKLRFWILGTLTALAGVFLVRVAGPYYYAGDRTLLLLGYVAAVAGLFIITLGTRKKE